MGFLLYLPAGVHWVAVTGLTGEIVRLFRAVVHGGGERSPRGAGFYCLFGKRGANQPSRRSNKLRATTWRGAGPGPVHFGSRTGLFILVVECREAGARRFLDGLFAIDALVSRCGRQRTVNR